MIGVEDVLAHLGVDTREPDLLLQLVAQRGEFVVVGDRGEGVAMLRRQLLGISGDRHRLSIAVAQQDESRWHRQSGAAQFAEIGALAAGVLGIVESKVREFSDHC